MAPRQDVSGERREEIVNAASRVFARRGFRGARMDDIVRESGLSKGLLYWYFKSKDAVIGEVLKRMLQPLVRETQRLAGGGGTAEDRLRSLGAAAVKEFHQMGKIVPITFELYALAFRNKVFRKVFTGFFVDYVDAVAEVVKQGVAAGEFQPTDARAAAMTMGSIVEGTMLLWLFDSDAVKIDEQVRYSVDVMIRGLMKQEDAAPGPKTSGAGLLPKE